MPRGTMAGAIGADSGTGSLLPKGSIDGLEGGVGVVAWAVEAVVVLMVGRVTQTSSLSTVVEDRVVRVALSTQEELAVRRLAGEGLTWIR